MRYLGIDFGTKKVGVALSDEGGQMAFPHSVVPTDKKLIDTIVALIAAERVGAVVVGRSHTLSGAENPVAKDAQAFADVVTKTCGVPVYFESEVYSTQQAMRDQGRNSLTDASAAAIILNSYLERQKHTS